MQCEWRNALRPHHNAYGPIEGIRRFLLEHDSRAIRCCKPPNRWTVVVDDDSVGSAHERPFGQTSESARSIGGTATQLRVALSPLPVEIIIGWESISEDSGRIVRLISRNASHRRVIGPMLTIGALSSHDTIEQAEFEFVGRASRRSCLACQW